MRVVIAGTGHLGTSVLEPLLESRHQVVGVLQNGRKTKGFERRWLPIRERILSNPDSVLFHAARHRIPVTWIDRMDAGELAEIERLEADIVVACGFSVIFRKPLLELPRVGCINVHSSLLPKHRGPNPFAHAILANDSESGITFHAMDQGIDTGDILFQEAFPLEPDETALTVYYKACAAARRNVRGVLDKIEAEGITGEVQKEDEASYDPKLRDADFAVSWRRPAAEIERLVRAARSLSSARFEHRGRRVHLLRARCDPEPARAEPGTVLETGVHPRIATGEGSLSVLEAYATMPFSARWPGRWRPPVKGEMLS